MRLLKNIFLVIGSLVVILSASQLPKDPSLILPKSINFLS